MMNQSDPIEWIALSANLGWRRLWERREWSKERRRRMEESRESARWRRDCSSEEVLEMKDAAESCSSFACSTTLPTCSSIFFADSSNVASELSPISAIRIALWFVISRRARHLFSSYAIPFLRSLVFFSEAQPGGLSCECREEPLPISVLVTSKLFRRPTPWALAIHPHS